MIPRRWVEGQGPRDGRACWPTPADSWTGSPTAQREPAARTGTLGNPLLPPNKMSA